MPPLVAISDKPKRLKMIEIALKDRAPKLYRQLKERDQLQGFLESREEQMMASYVEAESNLITRVSGQEYQEQVQSLTMGQHQAWEQTLDVWLDFSALEAGTSQRKPTSSREGATRGKVLPFVSTRKDD